MRRPWPPTVSSDPPSRCSSPLGQVEPVNDSKTTNAIVALIRRRPAPRGGNETAAEEFVLSNLNLNADQAKEYGVIEYGRLA